MENSGFISDSELTIYINESLAELYDLLVARFGEDYFTKPEPFTIQTDGTEQIYSLPSDFYKARGVDLNLGGKESITLKPFMFQERNRYYNSLIYGWDENATSRARYRIIGRKLWIIPSPTGVRTIQVWYIPHAPLLAQDTDTFDAVNGWEQYLIVDTAIKMLNKEESDVSALVYEKEKLERRIKTMASNRDAGQSWQVSDVNRTGNDYLDGTY